MTNESFFSVHVSISERIIYLEHVLKHFQKLVLGHVLMITALETKPDYGLIETFRITLSEIL